VGALVLGAGCWTEGCERLSFYRGETDRRAAAIADEVRDEAARARIEALHKRFVDIADDSRKRAVPLAAATFVLGAALLALAARGLAGRSNARSALMQVVAAQALVVGATSFVLKDMRHAEHEWRFEATLAMQREKLAPDQYASMARSMEPIRRYGLSGWLVFRTAASALIFFALTRQRSREFFEAAAGPLSER
jgi:hypothetical protein